MKKRHDLFSRVCAFFRREQPTDEVYEGKAGYPEQRGLGSSLHRRDRCREQRAGQWIEQTAQDVRYAARQLGRSPLFASVTVGTLAVAIGANTTLFSIIDAVLLKPLPVSAPEELVLARWHSGPNPPITYLSGEFRRDQSSGRITGAAFSYAAFSALRDQQQTLVEVFGAAEVPRLSLVANGQAENVRGHLVSGNFFAGLKVAAEIGRLFSPNDDRPEAEPVTVISFETWQRRFGRSAEVLDRKILLNGQSCSIVGVLPRNFAGTLQFGSSPDVFLPLTLQSRLSPRAPLLNSPGAWWIQVMGRLQPGKDREQAQTDLARIFRVTLAVTGARSSQEEAPVLLLDRGDRGLTQRRQEQRQPLLILAAVAGLTLAMACSTVAGLMLARAIQRRREIGIRLALGASRSRLFRQTLIEGFVSGAVAGALGLLLARAWTDPLAAHLLPSGAPAIKLDWRVLWFTWLLSLCAALGTALVPAILAGRSSVAEALTKGWTRMRTQGSLAHLGASIVGAQVALAFVLLIGAALLLRTLHNLVGVELGVGEHHVVVGKIDPELAGTTQQRGAALQQIMERFAASPGVSAVGISRHHLLGDNVTSVRASVQKANANPLQPVVHANWVTNGYLDAMGVGLKIGIIPSRFDESAKEVLVNEAFVRAFLSDTNPLEARISGNQVVGVVMDTRYGNLRAPPPPTIYFPFSAAAEGPVALAVRSTPAMVPQAVRAVVAETNPLLPVFDLRTFTQQREMALSRDRLLGQLASTFGGVAASLTLFGVFGLVSYAVGSRQREFAIRIALGAAPAAILRQIFRYVSAIVSLGSLMGVLTALVGTPLLRSSLYGVSPSDPLTYFAIGFVFLGTIAVAAWIPARRASRIDPMVALRTE